MQFTLKPCIYLQVTSNQSFLTAQDGTKTNNKFVKFNLISFLCPSPSIYGQLRSPALINEELEMQNLLFLGHKDFELKTSLFHLQ